MLFSNSNLTASAGGLEWNGKKWSIVNHFIPFTEEEVNAPDRFESDFMVRHLEKQTDLLTPNGVRETGGSQFTATDNADAINCVPPAVSGVSREQIRLSKNSEACAVFDAGREIWRAYFERFPSFDYSIREKLLLNRPDVGWYQVRQALKQYGESADGRPTDFSRFESAYAALAAKLRPKVYEYGFLK